MKFCPECSNMLYVDYELDEHNNLNQSCKNCGYTEKFTDNIVDRKQYSVTNEQTQDYQIRYYKNDPSLMRTTKIKCANKKCPTNDKDNKSVDKEVVIFNKSTDYKVNYLCAVCNTEWSY